MQWTTTPLLLVKCGDRIQVCVASGWAWQDWSQIFVRGGGVYARLSGQNDAGTDDDTYPDEKQVSIP